MATQFVVWYASASHKKDRYFVGVGPFAQKVETPIGLMIIKGEKPTWADDVDTCTKFDTFGEAVKAKDLCLKCGYKGVDIKELLDDQKPALTEEKLDEGFKNFRKKLLENNPTPEKVH